MTVLSLSQTMASLLFFVLLYRPLPTGLSFNLMALFVAIVCEEYPVVDDG